VKLLLEGVNTRTPLDLKEFLTNGENKLQMFNRMKCVWTDDTCAARLLNKTRIIINEGIAHEITSAEGKFVTSEVISELNLNQEETDYRKCCTFSMQKEGVQICSCAYF
jgi:hypothetical protein